MTSPAAAIGRHQLDRLPAFVRARRENAAALTDRLAETPVETPVERPGARHAYHQYTVRTPRRDALAAHLDDRGIDTGVYYPRPIHEQPAYDGVATDLPVAERLAGEVLSLPVHPQVPADGPDRIATAVAEFFAGDRS
jgi:dTDP-4-amino-4,6-dideoxygalactose transaminase